MLATLRSQLGAAKALPRLMTTAAAHEVSITSEGLQDGSNTFLHQESRNLCRCLQCCSQYSMAKTMTSVNHGTQLTKILDVDNDFISAKWSDGHTGKIPRNLDAAYGKSAGSSILEKYKDLVQRRNTSQTFWTGENGGDIALEPYQYDVVLADKVELQKFLLHFMEYGVAILKGCPDLDDPTPLLNRDLRYGPVQDTIYGSVVEIKFRSVTDGELVAYTNNELPTHTDFSFYTKTPDILNVYGRKNTVVGGESTYVDTYAVLEEVRDERPDLFKILTEVVAYYRYAVPGKKLNVSSHRVVEMRGEDIYRVVDMFCELDELEFAKHTDIETRKAWWEAYSYYRNKCMEARTPGARRLDPGDLVMIDNARVLHGRRPFVDGTGERIMNLMYAEFSHVIPAVLDLHHEIHGTESAQAEA